ncbi:WD40-repeat-containing domain protein, partial [Baffinella frigidus]
CPVLAHQGAILSLAFAPSGMVFATSGEDGRVFMWGMDTGTALLCVQHDKSKMCCVAFSADSKWLASGNSDGIVFVWDA